MEMDQICNTYLKAEWMGISDGLVKGESFMRSEEQPEYRKSLMDWDVMWKRKEESLILRILFGANGRMTIANIHC